MAEKWLGKVGQLTCRLKFAAEKAGTALDAKERTRRSIFTQGASVLEKRVHTLAEAEYLCCECVRPLVCCGSGDPGCAVWPVRRCPRRPAGWLLGHCEHAAVLCARAQRRALRGRLFGPAVFGGLLWWPDGWAGRCADGYRSIRRQSMRISSSRSR